MVSRRGKNSWVATYRKRQIVNSGPKGVLTSGVLKWQIISEVFNSCSGAIREQRRCVNSRSLSNNAYDSPMEIDNHSEETCADKQSRNVKALKE